MGEPKTEEATLLANEVYSIVTEALDGIPGSAETVARGDSVTAETCTDSAQNLAEWVEATIDYLVLDEPRPATLDEYVSKPTLARKAKVKVRELARMGSIKPGPSDDYVLLLGGEITAEEYVRRLKADVDRRLAADA